MVTIFVAFATFPPPADGAMDDEDEDPDDEDHYGKIATPRNNMQETTLSGHIVRGRRILVQDFGMVGVMLLFS